MRCSVAVVAVAVTIEVASGQCGAAYRPGVDLLELHYDHAPDPDDGHSAALDRTMIDSTLRKGGCKSATFRDRLNVVIGTYGYKTKRGLKNFAFNKRSRPLTESVWGTCGGWLNADANFYDAVRQTAKKWKRTIKGGRRIFVKEGGPSEFTAAVIRKVYKKYGWLDFNPKCQVTVVQHSNWNEAQTDEDDMKYVKRKTNYVRISDANDYLKEVGKDSFIDEFKSRAYASAFGDYWRAAFKYYPSYVFGSRAGRKVIDASDSGELMEIMRLGEMSLEDCMNDFF